MSLAASVYSFHCIAHSDLSERDHIGIWVLTLVMHSESVPNDAYLLSVALQTADVCLL